MTAVCSTFMQDNKGDAAWGNRLAVGNTLPWKGCVLFQWGWHCRECVGSGSRGTGAKEDQLVLCVPKVAIVTRGKIAHGVEKARIAVESLLLC